MADVSKINVNGTSYNVKDATARGQLVPTGGTTGQALIKNSNTNNDVKWGKVSGLPDGGTTGQVLVKNSSTDGDAGWYTPGSYPTEAWYLPTGLTESNVLAAYQFVGRDSQANALINVNSGTSYPLTKSSGVTWSSANGFYIPATRSAGLYNATLNERTTEVMSAAFGYHGYNEVSPDDRSVYMPGIFMRTANSNTTDASNWSNRKALTINWIGDKTVYGIFAGTGNSGNTGALAGARNPLRYSTGVLSCNYNGYADVSLFYNGAGLSGTEVTWNYLSGVAYTTITLGQLDDGAYNSQYYVKAFVLFNTVLTAAQHLELYNNINALG